MLELLQAAGSSSLAPYIFFAVYYAYRFDKRLGTVEREIAQLRRDQNKNHQDNVERIRKRNPS